MKGELHAVVYFIADKPTKKNISKSIPLVGTNSYKTLLNWIADMHLDITRVRIYNQSDRPFDGDSERFLIKGVTSGKLKVIALGKKAAEYLQTLDLPDYYALPHPSGLNRQLNDKKKLKETLSQCQSYIYGNFLLGATK